MAEIPSFPVRCRVRPRGFTLLARAAARLGLTKLAVSALNRLRIETKVGDRKWRVSGRFSAEEIFRPEPPSPSRPESHPGPAATRGH